MSWLRAAAAVDAADHLLHALTPHSGALAVNDAGPQQQAAQPAIQAANRVLATAELPDDGAVLEVLIQTGADQDLQQNSHNPEQAERDATVRRQLVRRPG